MNVGLATSLASIPRPIATPRASTVFPAPSSPQSANTSFGRADRPSRSPSRSVWSEEWLTRSSAGRSRGSATRRSSLKFAALKDEPNQPPVEDLVMINSPQFMEEVNVHLIELPTTVIRNGHPVNDLPETAFKVLDEGKPVKVTKFEHVNNLPLQIGMAVDTSASMQPRMDEARKAGSQFFANVMKKGDRAFLVSFDTQPQLIQRVRRQRPLGEFRASLRALLIHSCYDTGREVSEARPQ